MLKIGVPSKGRLMEKTFDWFGARGVTMRQTGAEREYSGAVDGVDGVELVLLSAGEIPRELSAGRIHLGVTGSDLVRDKLADWDAQVVELAPLGFGHADLIIAVPAVCIDVIPSTIWTRRRRRFGRRMASGCGLRRSITGWCGNS